MRQEAGGRALRHVPVTAPLSRRRLAACYTTRCRDFEILSDCDELKACMSERHPRSARERRMDAATELTRRAATAPLATAPLLRCVYTVMIST